MCLIVFGYRVFPGYELVLLANRDEFLDRPTEPMHWWENDAGILAGKDLRGGGTWMGLNPRGEWAVLTNHRDPSRERHGAPSRGQLITDFLTAPKDPESYLQQLQPAADAYNGFNLLTAGPQGIWYFGNRDPESGVKPVAPGWHGLSNALLNTPWPKVVKTRQRLQGFQGMDPRAQREALFDMMYDAEVAPDPELPATGVPPELEKALSAPLIRLPQYATRSTTLMLVDEHGRVEIEERPAGSREPGRRFALRW